MAGRVLVGGRAHPPPGVFVVKGPFPFPDPPPRGEDGGRGAVLSRLARRGSGSRGPRPRAGAGWLRFVRRRPSPRRGGGCRVRAGIDGWTWSIYQAIHQYPSQIGLAAAYAVTLLLITSLGIYAQSRLSGQTGRFSTVTGKGFRPRTIDLGRWRYLTATIFILY